MRSAGPASKAHIYNQLKLRLTYQPGQNRVHAQANLNPSGRGGMGSEVFTFGSELGECRMIGVLLTQVAAPLIAPPRSKPDISAAPIDPAEKGARRPRRPSR